MKTINFALILALFCIASCTSKNEKPVSEEAKTAPAAPAKTIIDYTGIETSHSGYLLENGSKLYIARKENAAQLYLESADGKDAGQLTFLEDAVESYTLSPDESQLIFSAAKGGNEQYNFYLYSFKTGKYEPLLVDDAVRYEDPTWLNENEILYASNEANGKDFFIYHFDIAAKKRTLLVEKKGFNSITDALSKDDFLFYTYESNMKTVPYRFQNGKAKKIKVSDENKKYIPEAYFDGGILMKTNEKNDMEYLEIITDSSKKTIFEDKWGVESVVIDHKSRNEAVFCTNEEGYSRCFHYKKGEIKPLDFGKSLVGLNSLKNGKLVLKVSSEGEIPQPQVFDLAAKTTQKFGYYNANGIDVSLFAAPLLKKVRSFDGEEIPYFIYLPKTGKAPFPTIVYFHGGPEGQFRPGFTAQFQYYLSKGIAVVAPNVRGSSGYGRRYMDLDNYKLRMNSVRDGGAILEDLVKNGLSKPNSFVANGGSYGGFMTVASMAQFADDYICGIDNVGVVDLIDFLENTSSYRRHLREAEYGPLTDREFLASISPTNMVDKIKGELFVFHGANDPRVPVSDAYILIDKMKKAGKKVQKHIFEDEGHGYRKKTNRETYFMKSAEFIENCVKADNGHH